MEFDSTYRADRQRARRAWRLEPSSRKFNPTGRSLLFASTRLFPGPLEAVLAILVVDP